MHLGSVCLLLVAAIPAQVGLKDVPALARARAERLRPAQEQAMEPYWQDLALNYRENRKFLEDRFVAVVEIGDSIVPLLLERLRPVANNPTTRNQASNCRRILLRMDPNSFLDALLELVTSNNEVGRTEALRLLGAATSDRAEQALEAALAQQFAHERLILLDGFKQHKTRRVAPKLVAMLGSSDRKVRVAVLDYLIAAAPEAVLEAVLDALGTEQEKALLALYVEYLQQVAKGNPVVASVLLPFLDQQQLDWRDTMKLVKALGTIAPRNHEPTKQRLHLLLDADATSSLGLEAALSLNELGDKTGLKKLERTLTDLLRRPKGRRQAQLFEQRANMFYATGQYREAAIDYQRVLENSSSTLLQRKTRLRLISCEAHRRKWSAMLRQLQQIQLTYEELMQLAKDDPAVAEALKQDRIANWVKKLERN
ncbi:MAG: hypothetical protein VYE77_12115 [Planctomycetota bacterium]|nr:hypothetical protein [Planctomycetota bacterium]